MLASIRRILGTIGLLILVASWAYAQDDFDSQVGQINSLIAQAQRAQDENPREAVRLFREAHGIATALRVRAENSAQQRTVATNNLANVAGRVAFALTDASEHRESIRFHEECLRLKQEIRGRSDSIYTAWAIGNVGLPYRALGDYEEAERRFQAAVDAYERLSDTKLEEIDEVFWARHLNNLGYTHWLMGKYDDAVPHLRRARTLLEKYAEQKPSDRGVQLQLAELLNNQGLLLQTLGQYEEALSNYERSRSLREHTWSPRAPSSDRAQIYSNLGAFHALLGRNDQAKEQMQRALAIWPRGSADRARTLNALGYVLHKERQLGAAESHYRDALAIWQGLKETHVHQAATESSLGWLLYERNDAGAENLLRNGLKLREAKLPKNHPHIALSHQNLAALFASTGRDKDALDHMTQARQILRNYISQRLPFQPEEMQLSYLLDENDPGSHASALQLSLSLGLKLKDDAKTLDDSAAWLLNGKAVAQESLAVQAQAQRQGASALAKELRALQVKLASLTLTSPASGTESAHRKRVEALEADEQELKAKLVKEGGFAGGPQAWIDIQNIRSRLPRGAVYIDIAQFRVWDFEHGGAERWSNSVYAAWVVHQGQPNVQVVPLGDAAPLNDAVAGFRKVMKESTPDPDKQDDLGTIRDLGRADSEKLTKAALQKLSDLLLKPLAKAGVMQAQHWVISPDADLWLAPWCALPLDDGKYAVEKHAISYVVTGRDLVREPLPAQRGQALVLARPAYGQFDAKKGIGLSFEDLKNTAEEAQAILPSLERISSGVRGPFMGQDATIQTLHSNPRPDVLVLSTHGYFLDDALVQRLNRPGLRNPLRRCGLALTNANTGDGLLDGARVTQLDLQGTRLAVLSACVTGVGKVNRGEGVASLRQAFHLAGARTVAATLWEVPDVTSKDLVIDYFRNVAGGMNHAVALQQAQRQVIAEKPGVAATSHPLFWAAYALTGPVE